MSAPSPKPIKSTPGRENPEHAFAVHSEEPLKEGNSTRVIGRNLFFDPPGAQRSDPREEPDKRRVYAAIEVPEFGDGPKDGVPSEEPVFLECIDAAWFDVVLLDPTKRSWVDLFREVPLLVLELTEYALPAYPAGAQPGDIAWYEFAFEAVDPSESDARAYTGLYADGAAVRITSHEQRPMGWTDTGPMGPGGWLAQIMRSQPRDSEPQELLRSALSTVDCRGGVAVYDVGQGACQAALDGSLHLPSLYVDFGGGVLTNRKTFSDELAAFCFSRRPIVLLSHWDWDHWSSAYRHEASMSVPWFAPPVPLMPIQQAFAADLYTRGSLHLWDDSWPATIREGAVFVERCTGRTSNDAGLAVTLQPFAESRKRCLLPGDAAYSFIPSVCVGLDFNALCMTHHGGRLHSSVYPKAKRGAAAALSAGLRNTYCHPLFHTMATHLAQGWKFPTATGLSGQRPCHVLLPWGGQPLVFQGGCHAATCNVAIAQVAPPWHQLEYRMAKAPAARRSRSGVVV